MRGNSFRPFAVYLVVRSIIDQTTENLSIGRDWSDRGSGEQAVAVNRADGSGKNGQRAPLKRDATSRAPCSRSIFWPRFLMRTRRYTGNAMKTAIWPNLPAALTHPQLFCMQVFTRIVRAAGDCSREDHHAVYGTYCMEHHDGAPGRLCRKRLKCPEVDNAGACPPETAYTEMFVFIAFPVWPEGSTGGLNGKSTAIPNTAIPNTALILRQRLMTMLDDNAS